MSDRSGKVKSIFLGKSTLDAFVLRWATLAMCNAFFTFGEARIWLSGHACVAVVCTRTEQTS